MNRGKVAVLGDPKQGLSSNSGKLLLLLTVAIINRLTLIPLDLFGTCMNAEGGGGGVDSTTSRKQCSS